MRFPVTLDIKPSRRLRAALVLVHLGVLPALWLSAIDWRLIVAGSVLPAASLVLHWRRQQPCRLQIAADGSLYRLAENSEATKLDVLPGAVVLPWLVAARVRDAGAVRALLVLPDSLTSDQFRALRIWLRWLAVFRTAGVRA